MEEKSLVVAEQINAIDIFVKGGLDAIIQRIETGAKNALEGATLETAKGRAIYKSAAFLVARSKTLLDAAGKDLNADLRDQINKTDAERRRMREACDKIRDTTREPLTKWEAAEEKRVADEKAAAELAQAWDDAIAENDLFDRKREIERKEAEFARIETERRAKEEAERIEKERIEREKRIAEEAAERARKEVEEKALKEKQDAEKRERDAKEAAERERLRAELAEKQRKESEERAERDRIAAAQKAEQDRKEAAEKAEASRIRAIAEAEQRERDRQAEEQRLKAAQEAKERAAAEKLAKDKKHRAEINRAALASFEINGIDTATAKTVISLIAKQLIDHIRIEY